MIDILEDRIKNNDFNIEKINFKINNIDVLKYFPSFEKYDVVANIPYYITSPILRHFLYELENKPENMLILMQKDVADKILDNKKTSVLSLIVAKKANVYEKIFV
jgi:16S rRNA (adenine1518-N6/adenine1519-N6)-dimethyltransferase